MERQGREQEETLPEKYILKKRKTMNPLYNFAISAYRTAVRIASVRNDKAKRMLQGHAETFGILKNNIGEKDDCIWIHASSLGEFEQGRPIIESIKSRNPGQKILLTFFSPSGYDVRKDYPLADTVCYLPFDLPRNVEKFLDMEIEKLPVPENLGEAPEYKPHAEEKKKRFSKKRPGNSRNKNRGERNGRNRNKKRGKGGNASEPTAQG